MIKSTLILDNHGGYTIRRYTEQLEKYGKAQEDYYGEKEKLIKQVEKRYKDTCVKLGRYVRHLCGEIILFFPHKTGLIGMDWAQRQWQGIYIEDGSHYGRLFSLTPGIDTELPPVAYQHLYRSFGLVRDDLATIEYRRLDREALYVYQYGILYKANYAKDETLYLSKVLLDD